MGLRRREVERRGGDQEGGGEGEGGRVFGRGRWFLG